MSEIVRCPDCGGIVGATEATDEGPPCACFGQPGYKSDPQDPSNTQVMSSPTSQKICCMCGKDLAGHKRLKDSMGYWCPECHAEDQKKKEVHGVKCEKCGRIVPEQSLTDMDGKRICTRCVREERDLRRPGSKRFHVISDKTYKETEKRTIIILAVVLVILGILAIIAWQRRPWKNSLGPAAPSAPPAYAWLACPGAPSGVAMRA